MANALTRAWGKYVKDPINKAGNAISKGTQAVTDKIGLSTPDLPESARPVLDPEKIADLAAFQGQNRQNIGRWKGQTPGGPGYFTPQTFKPTQARDVATPNYTPEQQVFYDDQTAGAPTEQSLAPLALQRFGNRPLNLTNAQTVDNLTMEGQQPLGLGRVSGNNPNTAKYGSAADQALQERLNTQAPTQAGYDPARKQLAMQEMTAGLDAQKKDAEEKLTEQLSKAGILNSSVGQAELAKLRQGYDQQKTSALTQVNLEDLAANRQDRYLNADQASSRFSQISNLAAGGQGLGLQGAQFKSELTAQDNAAIQAEAQDLMQKRGIDRNTAMQMATFNRESGQMNNQNVQTQEQFNRQGIDANNAAATQEANYGRQGRQIDTQNLASLAQQNFGNRMTTEGYNRQGRQMGTDEGWRGYEANVQDAIRRSDLSNQAQIYNIGNQNQAKTQESNAYQQDLNSLARGASGDIYTPQSQAAADEYAAKQALQTQRLQGTMGLATTAATAYAGAPKPKRNPNLVVPRRY